MMTLTVFLHMPHVYALYIGHVPLKPCNSGKIISTLWQDSISCIYIYTYTIMRRHCAGYR